MLSAGDVPEAPVLRDAAEILSDEDPQTPPEGLGTAAAAAGLITCALLAFTGTFPGSDVLPSPLRLGLLSLLYLVVASRISARTDDQDRGTAVAVLVSGVVLSSVAAVVVGILNGAPVVGRGPDAAVGTALVGGCLTGAVVLTLCSFCCRVQREITAALTTCIILGIAGAGMFPVAPDYAGVAAAAIGFALITVAALPSLTIRVSGLTVPRLPPAGEDLGIPEDPNPDVEEHALCARELLSGALAGTALAGGCCALVVGWSGGGFPAALCLATTIATVLHALRHRSPLAVWALWSWSLCAAGGTVLAGVRSDSVVVATASSLMALAVLTVAWWGQGIADLRPVAVNWMERIETLAVAAALPLSAHILGIFALVRGLG